MKIVSPVFAVALAVAVLAPGIDIAGATTCADTCSSCDAAPTTGGTAVSAANPATAGTLAITAATGTCDNGQPKYMRSLTVSEVDGKEITVAFKHGTSGTFNPVPQGTSGLNPDSTAGKFCSWTYADVGRSGTTLTGDVSATVTCGELNPTQCNVKSSVTYGCPPSACATKSPDGSTSATIVAATTGNTDPSFPIPVPTGACPYGLFKYISDLKVSEDKGLGISVTFAYGSTTVAEPIGAGAPVKDQDNGVPKGSANCYYSVADVGIGSTLTNNVVATVKCTDNTAACNIKYKVTYACSAKVGTCPVAGGTGQTSKSLSASDTSLVVQKTGSCDPGQFKYLTTLDVRGSAAGPVAVTFNNDLTPVEAAKGDTCFYYKDVMGLKAHATDMVATIKCKTGTSTCSPSYAATWNCTAPIMYTRTSTDSEKCGKLSDCENRCAKSYQLIAATTYSSANPPVQTTTMKLKSPPVAGCTCVDIETSTDSTPATGATAKTTDGLTTVQVVEGTDSLTVTSTVPDKECVSTYKRVSFENKFVAKPYTRTAVLDAACTPDPTNATPEEICANKCAAEISLTKSQTDMIRATPATVDGCTCPPIDAYVGDDSVSASYVSETVKYDFAKVGAVLKVKTTTPSGTSEQVCNAEYKESCSKLCTDPGCGVFDIPAGGLPLTNLDGCPKYTYSYPKIVTVRGLLAENAVSVVGGTAASDQKFTGSCFKTYQSLVATPASLKADSAPVVSCGASGCKAAVNTVWGCTDPLKCPDTPVDFTKVSMTSPNVTGFVVKAAADKCTAPAKAYLKSLDIRLAGKDINVAFNNGLNPAPSSKGPTCKFYSNVIGLTAASTDVTATISCASTNTDGDKCDVAYSADWGCYTPAAAPVYTRKGAPVGRGCVTDLSTCASRCAKSYQLVKTDTVKMLVPQITPDGCYCPALTGTTDATTTTKATNPTTTMEVNEVTASNTLTVEYTAPGKECKTTFAKAAFANSFVAETYARGAVTPATCVPAADADAATTCAYACAAELSIKPLGVDALNVTQAVVTTPADCTCDPFMAYVDVDGATASGPLKTSTVEIKQTTGAVTVKTTTGSTVCTATYAKKTAPPPPTTAAPTQAPTPQPTTTTKTGTSAGVSALGAGADAGMVTVTLVAAAAGVQAVGLPA